MTAPDLFVIGAARTGTTALCTMLDSHPEIELSRPKEPEVLLSPVSASQAAEAYSSCFSEGSDAAVRLEGSTSYSLRKVHPGVAERVAATNPAARIIYVLRDPADRARSLWVQYRSSSRTDIPEDFNRAVREVPDFVDGSKYFSQVSEYQEFFPPERILVLQYDDFRRDPVAVARQCIGFVGLDSKAPLVEDPDENASSGKRQEVDLVRAVRRGPLRAVLKASRRFDGLRSVKIVVRDRLAVPIPEPRWDASTLEWFEDQIAEDLEQLEALIGGLPASWRSASS